MTESIFSQEDLQQLDAIFSRLSRKVALRLQLDEGEQSDELKEFISQLAHASNGKLEVQVEDATQSGIEADFSAMMPQALPIVRILAANDAGTMEDSGIAFHGVPTGLEFNSFIIGICDAGGDGQEIDQADLERVQAIQQPVDIMLLVSLTCPYCEATVEACDRIASLTPNIRAEAYDIALYPQLDDQYNVEGVPVVIVGAANSGAPAKLSVGARDVSGMLDLIEQSLA